jgi:hypothetical protein
LKGGLKFASKSLWPGGARATIHGLVQIKWKFSLCGAGSGVLILLLRGSME